MIKMIGEFCLRHNINFEGEPIILNSSMHSWFIKDSSGKQWVLKSVDNTDRTPEILKQFSLLHPPFQYPLSVSDPDERFLLYPFIEGRLLKDEEFEDADLTERVMEKIGRLQALMRSMVLVPFYEDTIKLKGEGSAEWIGYPPERLSMNKLQGINEQQMEARHREIAESYHWTQKTVQESWEHVRSGGLWADVNIDEFRDIISDFFPLHIPMVGTNLSHTALTPEHLLVCPDGTLGIVGWHIAPRPRFYMQYTYLMWSFFSSNKAKPGNLYRERLRENSSHAFRKVHLLVFAFCLLEQLALWHREKAAGALPHPDQRIMEAKELFVEAVEEAKKKEEAAFQYS